MCGSGFKSCCLATHFQEQKAEWSGWAYITCFSLLLEQEEHHLMEVDSFVEEHGKEYLTVKVIRPDDEVENAEARNLGM